MLKDYSFQNRWKLRFWPKSPWARGIIMVTLVIMFLGLLGYSIEKGSSKQLVRILADQSFPFEAILIEGMSGYSAPERETLHEIRAQGVSLGMFLLTGVNITDARTYFFSYFTPPPGGPAWIGWAYNPGDPEFEGLEIEAIPPEESEGGDNKTPHTPISEDVLVGIYHTHSSESYIGDGGVEREKGNGEIVKVGETLKNELEKSGVETVHALDVHDEEDFNMAYSKSIKTATKLIKDYPSMKVLIDLHRDGLPPGINKSTVKIKGKEYARVMIVIGQKNPHWTINEEVAKKFIAIGEEKYPGVFKSDIFYASDARYNQHLLDGGLIIEIGSQFNTFEESNNTAALIADVLTEYLKEN